MRAADAELDVLSEVTDGQVGDAGAQHRADQCSVPQRDVLEHTNIDMVAPAPCVTEPVHCYFLQNLRFIVGFIFFAHLKEFTDSYCFNRKKYMECKCTMAVFCLVCSLALKKSQVYLGRENETPLAVCSCS